MYKNARENLANFKRQKKEIRAFVESLSFKNIRREIAQQEEHMRRLSTVKFY